VKKKRSDKSAPASAVRRDAEGRAHLVIQRDGSGRAVGLALSQAVFKDAWQNDVAVATAATAHAMLGDSYTPAQAAALGRSAMAATSKIVDGALAQSPERPPACRAGCAHCCHQAVGVTPPEVFAIYQHLRATRTPDELMALAEIVSATDDQTRGLSAADRLSPTFPCPFLRDARCSIYEARPLACRGTNSLDAAACERNLRDPAARAAFLRGETSVPCYLEPLRASHAVTAGLQLALDQLHGLEMLPLELTAAMRVMFEDPDGAPQRWLGGKDPFAAAHGGDMTDDPRIRELSGRV
jgi:hypothetical protein